MKNIPYINFCFARFCSISSCGKKQRVVGNERGSPSFNPGGCSGWESHLRAFQKVEERKQEWACFLFPIYQSGTGTVWFHFINFRSQPNENDIQNIIGILKMERSGDFRVPKYGTGELVKVHLEVWMAIFCKQFCWRRESQRKGQGIYG